MSLYPVYVATFKQSSSLASSWVRIWMELYVQCHFLDWIFWSQETEYANVWIHMHIDAMTSHITIFMNFNFFKTDIVLSLAARPIRRTVASVLTRMPVDGLAAAASRRMTERFGFTYIATLFNSVSRLSRDEIVFKKSIIFCFRSF